MITPPSICCRNRASDSQISLERLLLWFCVFVFVVGASMFVLTLLPQAVVSVLAFVSQIRRVQDF
jgi:hypothetical protein